MSIRAGLFRAFIRRHVNVNPELNDHVVESIRKLDRFNSQKPPRGYVLERFATEKGTRYERVYRKGAKFSGKAVLYLHGGAYIGGLNSVYRKMSKRWDEACGGAEVYLLDYNCAPQYQYPTQLRQALDLWDELVVRLHYDPQNIVVGGDSAGGNLTLALLLSLRDAGAVMPKAAVCFSPWADMTASGQSYDANYRVDVMFGNRHGDLTAPKRNALLGCDVYCFVGDADRTCPYVSPVFGDYHGFPPMFFTVGGDEVLLSDTLTIADKLRANGVAVEVEQQPKMFHVYVLFASVLPEAKQSFDRAMAFVSSYMRA